MVNKLDRVKGQYKNHHKVKVLSIELSNRNNLDAPRDRVLSIELSNRNNLDAPIYRDRLIYALLYMEID